MREGDGKREEKEERRLKFNSLKKEKMRETSPVFGDLKVSIVYFSVSYGYFRFLKSLTLSISVIYSKPTSSNFSASFSVLAVLTVKASFTVLKMAASSNSMF